MKIEGCQVIFGGNMKIKKKLKRILAVITVIVAVLLISYLIYTGGQAGA